jgi:hypothetical protein
MLKAGIIVGGRPGRKKAAVASCLYEIRMSRNDAEFHHGDVQAARAARQNCARHGGRSDGWGGALKTLRQASAAETIR